ncbi:glycine zipper 2TM domain-containing protein [Massilia sp. PAMC28688]|uniref:glycine zipper 2TM domain-containing protein n=1 Tax=Massilia sp. PAMC28688 TaxID=2861283 RepID=UPI001C629580|nr:glycine zipper 2TM domain-containing protein [Massilia sp. PAMC28688]QYF94133.1 glycine zipper 2TM domain-containing protein [Massilia sp. PAMC28688]
MLKRHHMLGLLFVSVMTSAAAGDQRTQYAYDTREVAARFAEDRAICAEERNHGQRKKCLRTAGAERDRAMAQLRAQHRPGRQHASVGCHDCARVTAVNVSEQRGDSNALGVVAGGAAGALLGSQIGDGSGKTAATIAGAVGGAYLGKRIQEKSGRSKVWQVEVEYENGRRRSFSFDRDPGIVRGDRVRNAGTSITRI